MCLQLATQTLLPYPMTEELDPLSVSGQVGPALADLFTPDSNQEDFTTAIKPRQHPLLVCAAAPALLLLAHKWAVELSYPPEGRRRGGNKPLLARLACSDSPVCPPFFAEIRMLGSTRDSSAVLNRTAGLWLLRDSVIWVATGGFRSVYAHISVSSDNEPRGAEQTSRLSCVHTVADKQSVWQFTQVR